MDLIALGRVVRKHWVLCLLVALVTALGATYLAFLVPTKYEQTKDIYLIAPPSAASEADVARDPTLARAVARNPFMSFGEPATIVDVVSTRLSSPDSVNDLVTMGVDGDFTIEPVMSYGRASPIARITVLSDSLEGASRTTQVVSEAFVSELDMTQSEQSVHEFYRIAPYVVWADDPVSQTGAKLRSLIAAAIAGGILLFVVLSVAQAWDVHREKKKQGKGPDAIDSSDDLAASWSRLDESESGDQAADRPTASSGSA